REDEMSRSLGGNSHQPGKRRTRCASFLACLSGTVSGGFGAVQFHDSHAPVIVISLKSRLPRASVPPRLHGMSTWRFGLFVRRAETDPSRTHHRERRYRHADPLMINVAR